MRVHDEASTLASALVNQLGHYVEDAPARPKLPFPAPVPSHWSVDPVDEWQGQAQTFAAACSSITDATLMQALKYKAHRGSAILIHSLRS